MEKLKLKIAYLLLPFFLFSQSLNLCASINVEGSALLRFRERIVFDPYGAMLNWNEESDAYCSWFGVACNSYGRVVALNLQNLLLVGTLAPELGKLLHLKYIILHNNSFHGTIPKEIGELQKLEVLDVGYNNFCGPFPLEIKNILSLKTIVLRSNHQIGHVPAELHEVHSPSNHLDMERQSKRATTWRVLLQGNHRKHKHHKHHNRKHMFPVPSPSTSPSTIRHTRHKSEGTTWNSLPPIHRNSEISPMRNKHGSMLIIILSVSIGVAFLILLVSIYFLTSRNKGFTVMPQRTGLTEQLQKAFVTGVPSLKCSELELACEDFSNVVGSLSDCILYKGTLSSGVEIAVTSSMITSAKDWSDHNESQFRSKITTLSKVNHKNFMNLIGYCEEEEPFTRMMVYEYAPNGTLFEHLHIKEADHLDWPARLRIIMGAAYCLDHLHQLDPPVILNSLSSSSIYLCDDYAAKISNLSFAYEEKETDSELSYECSRILDSKLSTQDGNVYKFGILLLEIISGRLPYSKDDGLLVLWASSHLMGKRPLMEMVDTTLESFGVEDVIALTEIIKMCIHSDPKKRPKMMEVVTKLREITKLPPAATSPKLSALWWAELEIISTEGDSLE